MATHLVTGYAGTEHIKSEDQGSFNASFFGTGQFVMEAGNQLEASIIDNNTVRILDGDILMKGRHIRVNPDTYEDMIIENGTAGVNRCDLIVMEYSKVPETGIETATLKVLKGTATSGTASAPSYTDGDILTGAILNQMPLYKVLIEGVVLVDVVSLFDTIPTFQTLAEMYRAKFIKDCETHLNSLGILDTMEEVNANTQDNQLAGAKAVKELGEDLACYYPPRKFQSDEDALVYAVSLLETKDNIFVPFSIVDSPGCGSEYSSGFITVRWDTCSVVIFNYQSSRINVNSRSKDGKWTGWEQAAFYRELANYLPLTGGNMVGPIVSKIDSESASNLFSVRNTNRSIELLVTQSEEGLYDEFRGNWILYVNPSNNLIIPKRVEIGGDLIVSSILYAPRMISGGSKVLTAADFVVSGSTSEAKLTINLD